ncbi:C40 family peptidase [Mycobacterium seoulense]|uniref:C40 family peptidase n=1 Tax=Mycobacterium seoulense TaxID=386911 RepID=UPI003CEF369C
MATMDQHLAAMQRQLDQTTAQNRLLALRLRELAAGYRGIGSTGMGGMPLSGLGGLTSGSGGLSGVTGLASGIPASLMGSLRSGGGEPGGESGAWMFGGDGRGRGTALRAVQYAETKLGCPYVWGATGPRTYDCSGLVMDAYAHAGVRLPRMTYDMIRVGMPVDRADVRAGDLVFSDFSGRGPEHVQLAVGLVAAVTASAWPRKFPWLGGLVAATPTCWPKSPSSAAQAGSVASTSGMAGSHAAAGGGAPPPSTS